MSQPIVRHHSCKLLWFSQCLPNVTKDVNYYALAKTLPLKTPVHVTKDVNHHDSENDDFPTPQPFQLKTHSHVTKYVKSTCDIISLFFFLASWAMTHLRGKNKKKKKKKKKKRQSSIVKQLQHCWAIRQVLVADHLRLSCRHPLSFVSPQPQMPSIQLVHRTGEKQTKQKSPPKHAGPAEFTYRAD